VIPAFLNTDVDDPAPVSEALERTGAFRIHRIPAMSVTEAVRDAVRAGARRVVAAGGDGTISAVAAGVAESDVELAVVPAGTFNHFAKDNGIPLDLDKACELAARGTRVKPVDVAWVNGRLFLNTSSVGVYANFVKGRDKWEPRFGYWFASTISVIRNFLHVQPFTLWFSADGAERAYETPLVFIGVGERELKLPTLGNRVRRGKPGLHVMIVRGRTRARLVALAFAAAARGVRAVSRTPHLDTMMLDRCRIEQRHSTLAVDGEIVRLASPLEYRFGEGAVKLVVPTLEAGD
jgi:diacylglycerol kinase family enzyme